ncbi:SufD family Fe-S cluster assembly protein [Collinsella tanakaei]|uniref:SufD family Fe-S cluster assembly protein n=1 Tax=Collinsella tanakaei TaxID=626935 RepID=A0A3E4QRI2_9ACTN|nr:SufD family Fe-S cluster assembly protein [Collinsella tanakaei]RGL09658.1 SufD family Fe-S cluster assembly protein [Collinsella tanakaei]
MDALVIKKANAMPAPTWSWLKMNETKVAVPAGLERDCQVVIENAGDLLETHASFEGAVEKLQQRVDARRGGDADTRAILRAAQGHDAGASDLDTPALSSYEKKVALSQIAGDVAADFETGVGRDARAYLNFLAGGTAVLATEPGDETSATVRVSARPGTSSSASIDVVAAEDSELDLAISIDAACGADQAAFAGSALRVFAGERSRVNVTVYLTCGAGVTCVEDSGFVLDDDARVTVRHVVLGGSFTATGLAADLRGDRSRIDIDTSYLGAGADERDFNYIVRHRGKKTECNLDANGVLTGTSKKILRGTIDLMHGAKGAQGNERETVLLANKGVDNKTVPMILCDEDDVAGNHGATIGHVRPEQLFYMGCRGLSEKQAEELFISAKLEDAAITAPDEQMRDNVVRLASTLVDNFEEEIA